MIKIDLPDRTLTVSFYHQRKVVPVTEGFKLLGPTHRIVRSTKCEIRQLTNAPNVLIVLGTGVAKCDPRDNFSKDTGRKLALTHALRAEARDGRLAFSKFERTVIWEAYHNRGVEDIVLRIERESQRDQIQIGGDRGRDDTNASQSD